MEITLHSRRPVLNIQDDRVYFAFASGRYSYDCRVCGAHCCRGFGFELHGRAQVSQKLAASPSFAYFLQPTNGQHYVAKNCPPACFFLASDLRCRVQEAKPETCRLFPFSSLKLLSDYLIVEPHPGLCPLRLVPHGQLASESTYQTLIGTMQVDGLRLAIPEVHVAGSDIDEAIRIERTICNKSDDARFSSDYLAFANAQTDSLKGTFSWTEFDALTFAQRAQRALGIHEPIAWLNDPDLSTIVAASTPVFRSQLVFRPTGAPFVDHRRVPHMLVVLYIMLRLAKQTGMFEITYQTVSRVFSEFDWLLKLIAYADSDVVWRPGVDLELLVDGSEEHRRRYLRIARHLVGRRSTSVNFGELLSTHAPESTIDRMDFFRRIAPKLVGKIVPRQHFSALGRTKSSLKSRVQRIALQAFSETTLVAATERFRNTAFRTAKGRR